MGLRSGEHGYGWVTKVLHWLTVLLVAAQFVVGYSMDLDDGCDRPGEKRSGGDTSEAFEERLDRLEGASRHAPTGWTSPAAASTSPSCTCCWGSRSW